MSDSTEGDIPNPLWKIMFFFASDNPLSPLIVSQLKAIKDAGFQTNTDVLVYFDPMEPGTPTKLYNVNRARKESAFKTMQPSQVGDGADPFVRNMLEDEVKQSDIPEDLRDVLAGSPKKETGKEAKAEARAFDALSAFIEFGTKVRPADNYILFLVGHGMIVGNDAFLPDEDPISAITLKQLGEITARFGTKDNTSLRLLALHSCSMSSIELAYQLRGTAEYLIATQGTAFVNSWPYRQLLKKIFNMIDRSNARDTPVNVKALVEKLYYLSLFNATDFMSAGYSADLALINLKKGVVERIKNVLPRLIQHLKAGLDQRVLRELILLAHLESQSFFEENYTDLFDFCLCLKDRCDTHMEDVRKLSGEILSDPLSGDEKLKEAGESIVAEFQGKLGALSDLSDACKEVMNVLSTIESDDRSERFEGFVIQEDNFGWKYQFAEGLSIYFPWSEPVENESSESGPTNSDRPRSRVLENYRSYAFTSDFKADSKDNWLSFLLEYFDKTKRASLDGRRDELNDSTRSLLRSKAEGFFNPFGTLDHKPTPEVGTRTPEQGISCTCPSIKNYPTDMRRNIKKFSITPGALRAFLAASEPDIIQGDE